MGQFTFEAQYGHDAKAIELVRTLGGSIELRHRRGVLLLTEAECRWLLHAAIPGLLAKVAEEPS